MGGGASKTVRSQAEPGNEIQSPGSDQKLIDMSNFNRNGEVNNVSTGWNRCKRIAARLYGQAIWMLVPLTLYFCALMPIDTFVPTQRSTKRPAALPVSKQEAEAIRDEVERLVESLIARNPIKLEYESSLESRSATDEIAAIENYVGTRLPEDIRYFVERFDYFETGNGSIRLLARRDMLDYSRNTTSDCSDFTQAPLTINGECNHPAIVLFDHNCLGVDAFTGIIWAHDGGQMKQVAPSFRALLRALDEKMEQGEEPDWKALQIP